MSRSDFLQRWRGNGGGWAFVWLNAPPPPHLSGAQAKSCPCPTCTCPDCKCAAVEASCICGEGCKCQPGDCPSKCPVFTGQQWGVGGCGPVGPCSNPQAQIGLPPTTNHVWGKFPNGQWGWLLAPPKPPAPVQVKEESKPVEEKVENYGVDLNKVSKEETYSYNGETITKGRAHQIIAATGSGLVDDTTKWSLTIVGDAAFQAKAKASLDKVGSDVKDKLKIQYFTKDHWAVPLFNLPAGISLRKPTVTRTAEEVGSVSDSDFTLELLLRLLDLMNPKPTPVPPPQPAPSPAPAPTPNPSPVPTPDPNTPPPAPIPVNYPVVALILGILYLLWKKKAN